MATGSVRFLGQLPDSELSALFASHSLVLALGHEDFGFAPLKAASAGRPALALRAGGALETVQDGVNGLLVEGDDPHAWACAMGVALARPWDLTELRRSTEAFQGAAFDPEPCSARGRSGRVSGRSRSSGPGGAAASGGRRRRPTGPRS